MSSWVGYSLLVPGHSDPKSQKHDQIIKLYVTDYKSEDKSSKNKIANNNLYYRKCVEFIN